MHPSQLRPLRRSLLRWYDDNRRDLPWRKTRNPYRVWVSEIMLQQTRVAAVLPRYEQFLTKFPSVRKLASANVSAVLAEWSGLGYYHRARNMHAAARVITRGRAGRFPTSAESWRELPGIGRYTAAAIASIAFNEPVAVLDGNVERVLRRLSGDNFKAKPWHAAKALIDPTRPGDFNQAMMELGATVCLPGEPVCGECPIKKFCFTRGRGELPRRKPRQQKITAYYGLSTQHGSVLLIQRSITERLMPGMWELPKVIDPASGGVLFSVRHSITTTNYLVTVIALSSIPANGKWVRVSRLQDLPLTGLAKKVLRKAKIIESASE